MTSGATTESEKLLIVSFQGVEEMRLKRCWIVCPAQPSLRREIGISLEHLEPRGCHVRSRCENVLRGLFPVRTEGPRDGPVLVVKKICSHRGSRAPGQVERAEESARRSAREADAGERLLNLSAARA